MSGMHQLLTMFVASGLLLMFLAIPLVKRRVPPNGWYGFRVPKTLSNARIWYPVNEHSGKQLYRTGLLTVLAAFALALIPGMKPDFYASACAAILVGDLLRGVVLTVRYLRTF